MFAIDRKRLLIPASSVVAILVGGFVWLFLRRLEWTYQEAGETVRVLVATHYIPRGTPLRPALFQPLRVPKAYVEPGAITLFEVLESSPGRPRFRGGLSIPEGSQLVQRELLPLVQNEGLSQVIPENEVAVSFGVDNVRGLGGNIQPGDMVDVLASPKGNESSSAVRTTALLFEAVPVVAVGKKWARPTAAGQESINEKDDRPQREDEETTTLTVLLNPLAAMRLAQARENDLLSVLLRAPGDDRLRAMTP